MINTRKLTLLVIQTTLLLIYSFNWGLLFNCGKKLLFQITLSLKKRHFRPWLNIYRWPWPTNLT